jgi:hypothetical protein
MLPLLRLAIGSLAAVVLLAACVPTVNTLPPVPTPTSPMRETVLKLPHSLEIRRFQTGEPLALPGTTPSPPP